jgi:hypothetical protein
VSLMTERPPVVEFVGGPLDGCRARTSRSWWYSPRGYVGDAGEPIPADPKTGPLHVYQRVVGAMLYVGLEP